MWTRDRSQSLKDVARHLLAQTRGSLDQWKLSRTLVTARIRDYYLVINLPLTELERHKLRRTRRYITRTM